MAEPKESHAKVPKAPESRLKRAAKQFGKYAGAAALATAITLSPFSMDAGKLFRGKPGISWNKAHAADKKTIPVSEFEEAVGITKKLIQEGKVQEIKFDLERKDATLRVKEWIIDYSYTETYHMFVGAVGNTRSLKKAGNERANAAPLILRSLTDLAASENTVELAYVKAYVVQRPDDPTQSVLIVACKDHLDFFILNDNKEIEWIPILLKDLGIEKKPNLLIYYDQGKRGAYIGVAIFDQNMPEILQKTKQGKIYLAHVYPKPEIDDPELSKAGGGLFTVLASR